MLNAQLNADEIQQWKGGGKRRNTLEYMMDGLSNIGQLGRTNNCGITMSTKDGGMNEISGGEGDGSSTRE